MNDFIVSQNYKNDHAFLRFLAFGFMAKDDRARESAAWYANCRKSGVKRFGSSKKMEKSSDSSHRVLAALLREVVLGQVKNHKSDKPLTLGLSAGFDSRPILMVLLENDIQVKTFTYGENGVLDFDFVNILCEKIRIDDLFFDVSQMSWNLTTYEQNMTNFQDFPLSPRVIVDVQLKSEFPERYEFHGHNHGVLSTVYEFSPQQSWGEAVYRFARSNDIFGLQYELGLEQVRSLLPSKPIIDQRELPYYWQLLLPYRLAQRILPLNNREVNYLLPYYDEHWVGFWLTRPVEDIFGQRLWLSFLRETQNELFFDLNDISISDRRMVRNHQIRLVYGKLWANPRYRRILDRFHLVPERTHAPLEHFDIFPTYLKNASFKSMIDLSINRLKDRGIFAPLFVDTAFHQFRQGAWRGRRMVNGLVTVDLLIEAGLLGH